MFRPQAQAELLSQPAGALRGSRPWLNIYLQKHLVVQASSYVVHDHFFYFYLDYKHKHTATGQELYALHLPPPPSFKNRLQAQARPRPGVKHQAAKPRTT